MSFLGDIFNFLTFGVAGLLLGALGPDTPDGRQPFRSGIPVRRRAFGEVRVDARYMLFEAKDGTAWIVGALLDGRSDGIVKLYLHDDVVTLDGDLVEPMEDGRYEHEAVSLQTRLGLAAETAYAPVVAAMPEIWTTDHRGDGITSIMAQANSVDADDVQATYPGGLVKPGAALRSRLCLDPRVTGMEADDPDTWAYSRNPVVQLLTYIITDGELGYEARIAPELASWIAAADVCDEAVAKAAGGTEPRYEACGSYEVDEDPAVVLAHMLKACDGWIAETGMGALRMMAGQYVAPTVTIPQRHILAFKVRRFTPDEEAVNEIVPTFTDPAQEYTQAEAEPWRDEADITRRGRVRSERMDLDWVPSFGQARRIAKRQMAREQAAARGTIVTDLYGLQGLGERYLTIELPLDSLASVAVEVTRVRIDLAERSLTFDWITAAGEAGETWDPETEEGEPVVVPEAPTWVSPEPLTVEGFAVAAFKHDGGDGSKRWAATAVYDTPVGDGIRGLRLETRQFGGGDDRAITTTNDLEHGKILSGALVADLVHEARIVPVVRKGRANTPTDWETFTTGKAAVESKVASGAVVAGRIVRLVSNNAGKVAAFVRTTRSHGKLAYGVALTSQADTEAVEVQTAGIVTGASGLTPGAPLYAGADGEPTHTNPETLNTLSLRIGIAETATTWRLKIADKAGWNDKKVLT